MLRLMPADFAQPERKINLQWPAFFKTCYCVSSFFPAICRIQRCTFFVLSQAHFTPTASSFIAKLRWLTGCFIFFNGLAGGTR
jgi:hypothetical protein